jgi:hypothetical protein
VPPVGQRRGGSGLARRARTQVPERAAPSSSSGRNQGDRQPPTTSPPLSRGRPRRPDEKPGSNKDLPGASQRFAPGAKCQLPGRASAPNLPVRLPCPVAQCSD